MASKYEISVLVGLIDRLSGPARRLGGNIKRLQADLRSTGKQMVSMGRSMTLGVTLPLVGFGTMALKASGELELLRTNMNVLTGSVEQGSIMYKDLVNFAAKTPFRVHGLANATSLLLQYGIVQKDVIPTMQMIGDVALGDANKFQLLSYAFGQIKGATILQGQELRQLINAGFNPLSEISRNTGKSMKQLKSEMSKGLITFEMVRGAFKSATSEGGRFYKGLEKGSQTLKGLFSTLQDNIQIALGFVGDAFSEVFDLKNVVRDLTKEIVRIAKSFKEFAKANPKLVKFFGILAMILALAGPLLTAIGFLAIGLGSLGALPIVAGIMAIATALALVFGNAKLANGEVKNLLASLLTGDWDSVMDILNEWDNQFSAWFATLGDEFFKLSTGIIPFLGDAIIGLIKTALEPLLENLEIIHSGIMKISSFVIGTPNVAETGIPKNESETDINLKVKTDSGSTVLVEGVKKKKGTSRVNVSTKGNTGLTTPAGALL